MKVDIDFKPAHCTPVLVSEVISVVLEGARANPDMELIHGFIYKELEELATFLGHFYYGLTVGSGRVVILRDVIYNPLAVRYMKLEDAVSLYNRRDDSYAYDHLNWFAKQVVMGYPNRGYKITLQRNSKSKYGVCSNLIGGVKSW